MVVDSGQELSHFCDSGRIVVAYFAVSQVLVKELTENLDQRLYLPRLAGHTVLLKAIADGWGTVALRHGMFADADVHEAGRVGTPDASRCKC